MKPYIHFPMERYDSHQKQRELYDKMNHASIEFPYDPLIYAAHRKIRGAIPETARKEITEKIAPEDIV